MTGKGHERGPQRGGLFAFIAEEHSAERRLCDLLESLADHLPGLPDRAMTATAIADLRRCPKRHALLEETYLYPHLVEVRTTFAFDVNLLVQIRNEHVADQALAQDAAELLEDVLERGRVPNPEMLGYMLRTFFECRRRHLTWEDEVVLPVAHEALPEERVATFRIEDFERAYRSSLSY